MEVIYLKDVRKKKRLIEFKESSHWSYGMTTVPERRQTTFSRSLDSLKLAGFTDPILFVDGCQDGYDNLVSTVVYRQPRIGAFGNWVLSAWELYLRNPKAKFYALFQDDILLYQNCRDYLAQLLNTDATAYWNLYAFPLNEEGVNGHIGFQPGKKEGKGALALVFNRNGLQKLLTSPRLAERPLHPTKPHRGIDGEVFYSMQAAGYKEMVHHPSLVDHLGEKTSMPEPGRYSYSFSRTTSFLSSDFDAASLSAAMHNTPWTIKDTLSLLKRPTVGQLPAPPYFPREGERLALPLESMARHMTDEGWQLFQGLQSAGYILTGYNVPKGNTETDVAKVIGRHNPSTLILQDKREWDPRPHKVESLSPEEAYQNTAVLKRRSDIFKLTICKDAHQEPDYHRQAAEEIDCHAWICYYSPRIVQHVAPYVRPQHLIRTYHTIDRDLVPDLRQPRRGCLLSGAVSGVYPLRRQLMYLKDRLPEVTVLKHPGYKVQGPYTPAYLRELCKYKVAICTASIYGYALRKIIEAVCCGCIVITDLPQDEVLPVIDPYLVRVSHSVQGCFHVFRELLKETYATYNQEERIEIALAAQKYYDYRPMGVRLANDIENLRRTYGNNR